MTIAVIVVVIVLLILAGAIVSYNRFVAQRNTVEESWRQVDVELQRRHDLIGNLVEVVKASARFEQNTLTQIVQARSQAMSMRGAGPQAQGQAEQALNGALSNFLAVAEGYPELKTSRDFGYLQQQMAECEDRVAAGRRFYNGNVRAYNTRIDAFPSSVIAGMGKFAKSQYYEVDDPQMRATPSLRGAFDSLNGPQQLPPQ